MLGLLPPRAVLFAAAIAVLALAGVYAAGRIYAAGAAAVRLEWARDRADALAKADGARRLAQARIDAAERKYLEDRTGDALRMAALEEALIAKDNLDADPTASCPARPAIPRGVSNALDAIGR